MCLTTRLCKSRMYSLILLSAATVTYPLGITCTAIEIQKTTGSSAGDLFAVVFLGIDLKTEYYSILGGIVSYLNQGGIFFGIGIVLFCLTIAAPIIKIVFAWKQFISKSPTPYFALKLSAFSMVDFFLIAVIILVISNDNIQITPQWGGLHFLTLSVFSLILASIGPNEKKLNQEKKEPDESKPSNNTSDDRDMKSLNSDYII